MKIFDFSEKWRFRWFFDEKIAISRRRNDQFWLQRPDLESTLDSIMRLKTQKPDLRTFLWSKVAPESTEGEKSPTQVKCSIRFKSNNEFFMSIYGFLGSLWVVLMRSCENFRSFNFFHGFWLKIIWILMAADLVSHPEGVCTFFLWKYLILSRFLNLKTPTEDSRLHQCLDL